MRISRFRILQTTAFLGLPALILTIGCGQSEPDRYKKEGTERPSKSIDSSATKTGNKVDAAKDGKKEAATKTPASIGTKEEPTRQPAVPSIPGGSGEGKK